MPYGLGIASLGSTALGFGAPTKTNSTTAKLYATSSGRGNAAQVDTETGDMVRDGTTGIHRGMDGVQQQVYLALRTLKGSAVVSTLGIAFKATTISETTARRVQDAVRLALADLSLRQLVRVDEVTSERVKMTGLRVSVKWTNLTNGETNVSRWTNG
jgi:hypothetical protein